jgi:hypothetical protein
LSTDEALDVLALRPGATASEIKEAYRDMVKVWHPDRFGNDLRLRHKAERQLKLINEAYSVLRSSEGAGGMHVAGSERASKSSPHHAASSGAAYGRQYSGSPIPHRHPGPLANRAGMRWIYRGLAISLILLVGYVVLERDPIRGAEPSRDSVGRHSAGIPNQEPLGVSGGTHVVHSADGNGAGDGPKGVGHSKEPDLRQFMCGHCLRQRPTGCRRFAPGRTKYGGKLCINRVSGRS